MQAQTLVHVGPVEVSVQEFAYAYNKGKSSGYPRNEKEIRAYLELYSQFRMKVLDAEWLGMDKDPAFIEELNGYRDRLAERFLLEREVNDKLVKEAYERSLKVIHASHILVSCRPDAPATDTVVAYHKIAAIRKKALSGTPFADLAVAYSEEPGAAEKKGDLGEFSAFQMIYPFETAAYQTPKGQVSKIVRTRFGYHLIKVHEVRVNPGQVEVAHIFISDDETASEEQSLTARAKAVELYKKLIQGAEFTFLAKQFSEYKPASGNPGSTQILTAGQSDRLLEKAAFALKNVGDISPPVKTSKGWHIMRLVRKLPLPAFEEIKGQLRNRIAGDERSISARGDFISRLKKRYAFREEEWLKNHPERLIDRISSSARNENELLFTLGQEEVVLGDFAKYVSTQRQADIPEHYRKFVQDKLTRKENQHLETKHSEFRYLMNEYRNGILLFNLSEKKIWNLALADSSRLKDFYQSRTGLYSWKQRADAKVYIASSAEELKRVNVLLNQNKTDAEILNLVNKSNPLNLVINAGIFERGSHMFVDRAQWQDDKDTEIVLGNVFVLVKIRQILPPAVKPFEEIESILLNDYQQHLESLWLKELREKYPVKINERELKKLVGERRT